MKKQVLMNNFQNKADTGTGIMSFQSVQVMQSKNKTGCDRMSSELSRQSPQMEGKWELDENGAH